MALRLPTGALSRRVNKLCRLVLQWDRRRGDAHGRHKQRSNPRNAAVPGLLRLARNGEGGVWAISSRALSVERKVAGGGGEHRLGDALEREDVVVRGRDDGGAAYEGRIGEKR